jgi:elongation factor G
VRVKSQQLSQIAINMRAHRAVRAVASAESSIGSIRGCASRPRFLCLNAPRASVLSASRRGQEAKRHFSQSTIVAAGAAEAVLKQAAADPSSLTQETIIQNLDQVERGRLARIRNIGIAVR